MSSFSAPAGQQVLITEFADNPLQGVEEKLIITEQQAPDPRTLKTNDVIIAVKSAAVGWVDLLMTSGQYQHMPSPPYCPGLEYSGEVVWTGADVDNLAVGDRVHVDPFLAGPRSYGDHQQYGGFASYAVAPANAVLPIGGDLSYDQACNLLGSYETAYHCLVTRGKLQAGETVLIHGASGATGLAAVHIAKILGATVIATGRSDDKLAVVKAQGADHVINCKTPDGKGVTRFRDEVKALTNGRGVEVVYDGVGGDITLESMRCVDFDARLLIVGWAATPFVAKGKGQRGSPNANQIPTNLVMMKSLQVLGCPTAISTQHNPASRAPRLQQIMAWVDAGLLAPYVSHQYPLTDVKQALTDKWCGQVIGGSVIHPPTS